MDQAGTWLLTINGYAPGSHAFQISRGVALDPQGNIHVTTSSSYTIKVFTPEGTYVRSYGDEKHPSGIVIDEEGYSFVSEWSGYCLSIFDPQGKKIHIVGNLKLPEGVILDPKSGSLYVANCIEVFCIEVFCVVMQCLVFILRDNICIHLCSKQIRMT